MAMSMSLIKKSLVVLVFFLAVLCLPVLSPAAERLAVATPIANIRNGPGTNFDVIWKVERFYPVLVLERKGDWCKIEDYEGDKGWVHGSLLDKTATIVVKKNNCNVRSGPGTNFPVAFRAKNGVPFQRLQTKGAWINIRHADGDTGWIHRSLVW